MVLEESEMLSHENFGGTEETPENLLPQVHCRVRVPIPLFII